MKLHTFTEAATELGIPEPWLRRNSRHLPKWKPPGSRIVRFTDDDLERIRAMFHSEPDQAPAVQVGSGSVSELTPRRARTSRASTSSG